MAFRKGERYSCPDPTCGCEIEVTRGAQSGGGGDHAPRCCCGEEMKLMAVPAEKGAAL